ncbi:hypothetical protein TIFTF001_016353 [Ficus carica]|uniref:Uncharacterized protein n=1 Tax=Ficus carica TaxID=3494 RepID=A0AA88A659_FICCA|nr:hypothetical protein TIFTF001_016353 [Ficus carica]
MPPVKEIDEFDDDVSHLGDYTTGPRDRRVSHLALGGLHDGPEGPSCNTPNRGAHFLLQAAANSVVAAAVADVAAAVAVADSLVLECLFIFKEN